MDGVLVDGEPLHFRAINQLLGEEGKSISLEAYKPYMGTKAGWRDMAADMGLKLPADSYSGRYDDLILEQYRTASVALPGAVALVRGLESVGVPIAVCSSSRRNWVETCLEKLGILDAFAVTVTGGDVELGKPAPDIYLLAAERLRLEPVACLAIEDAPAGIESASAAGMTVWAVRTEYTEGLELPPNDRELVSLVEVSIEDIAGVAA
jgi:HAD superfamily hydrolase (TIGR01509 family)